MMHVQQQPAAARVGASCCGIQGQHALWDVTEQPVQGFTLEQM